MRMSICNQTYTHLHPVTSISTLLQPLKEHGWGQRKDCQLNLVLHEHMHKKAVMCICTHDNI